MPNYQTPLKLKFPKALPGEWMSLIYNDTEGETPNGSLRGVFVSPAGRVSNEMLLTAGLIICLFLPRANESLGNL